MRPLGMKRAAPLVLAALAACAAPPPAPKTDAVQAHDRLVEAYWEAQKARWPSWATYMGDPRWNDRLEQAGPAARAEWDAQLAHFQEQLKTVWAEDLPEERRVTQELLALDLELAREEHKHLFHQWAVDQMDGPQSWFAEVAGFTPLKEPKDARAFEKRLKEFPRFFRQYRQELEEGLQTGRVAPRVAVERVIGQLEGTLKLGPAGSPWGKAVADSKLSKDEKALLLLAVTDSVYPALDGFRDFLKTRYLARARAEKVGLWALPGGKEAYRYRIRKHTTLPMTPDELHAMGKAELAAIQADMLRIARRRGYQGGLEAFFQAVKWDPANFFATRDEVEEAARSWTGRAEKLLPEYFGRLPKTPVVVKRIEGFREKDAVAAFYYQPDEGLTRPGIYYINTYEPKTRPRYGMAALAAHEAVPGHHLQIALALEADLPPFRRNAQFTAFTEGWGLYAERLAGEMGLYQDDWDRLGMLTYQAWRACRLVVDTGLHAYGWDREKAIAFMEANAPLSREEIVNEVDRYIIWPGQALAYMVGRVELEKLRAEARKELGERFVLKSFHDAVLKNGSIPLPVLQRVVRDWVAKTKA